MYVDDHLKVMNAVSWASLEAGVIATIITQPFWVIKTRMLLNVNPKINEITNFIEKTKEIHQHHRLKGFSKGLTVNLMLAVLGVAQMYVYEGSKILYDLAEIPQSQFL